MLDARGSERRWSRGLAPAVCAAAALMATECSFSSSNGSGSGSNSNGGSGAGGSSGSSAGDSGANGNSGNSVGSGAGSGAGVGSGVSGSGTVSSGVGSSGLGGSGVGGSGATSTGTATGGSGTNPTSGTSASGTAASGTINPGSGASSGTTAVVGCAKPPCVYEMSQSWPNAPIALATKPGKLTYTKKVLSTDFLSESCTIADFNNDGQPDVSSGRRWWEGPDFTKVHLFRGGHGPLPRAGAPTELQNGVSDDWSDFPWDVDGDGWTDIINIASASFTTTVNWQPMPQLDGTGYWYKNPGAPANMADSTWTSYEISNDMKLEQKEWADFDGDGKAEIVGSCHACAGGTKGYWEANWASPTSAWTFHPVTRTYEFPFGGTGWQHGLGAGDVDGDGHPDLLERSGVWIQPWPNSPPTTMAWGAGTATTSSGNWVAQAFSVPNKVADNTSNQGGSHMFTYDVNGDGLNDVVSADWAHGWGVSWYEQVKMPNGVRSCLNATITQGGTNKQCFVQHQIIKTNSAADIAAYPLPYNGANIAFSEPHAMAVADMDGDGIPDIVVGKMRFAHPYDQYDPDPDGIAVSFVFKTVRDATAPGGARFVPHQVDTGNTDTPVLPNTAYGVGRQIAVGHLNLDGIPDICVASKLGLVLFFGQ